MVVFESFKSVVNKTMYKINVRFNILISLLLVTTFVILCGGQLDTTGITVRLERVGCSCGKYCTFTTCKVKFISRYVANMNIVAMLRKEISEFKFTIKMFYKFSNNEYRPILIDTEIDFCDVQAGRYSSPLFNVIMNAYGNHSNLNRKCPFPPDEYYVKDLNFQAGYLPSIFPAGRYLINSTGYMQSNDWVYNTSIYFSVSGYGTKDLAMG